MRENVLDRELSPTFTLISAVYNVEKYLEEFIASVEAQDYPLSRVQVVMVDDGSTDTTPRILAEWAARRPELVTVITKENGGASSARNAGLPLARGAWVSFPDPDDQLAPDYLTQVAAFVHGRPEVAMAVTVRTMFSEATGARTLHPLTQAHFRGGNRVRNLDEEPDFFHESAPTAFFRTEIVARTGLRFDERVRPAFEDGHFCVRYLLSLEHRLVAYLPNAHYDYRKRLDKSSALDTSWSDPDHYTAQLEFGYLDVLQQARARFGHVPHWLQTNILYGLSWYFQHDTNGRPMATAPHCDIAGEFHRLLGQIASFLDPLVVQTFRLRRFDLAWRTILLHAYRPEPWHSDFVFISKLDTWHRLVRVSYTYTHEAPHEEYFSDGVPVEPVFAKTRSVVAFDRTLMFERIVWLPSGAIRARLDHTEVEARLGGREVPRHSLPLAVIRSRLVPRLVARQRDRARASARREPLSAFERFVVWLSATALVRRYFGNAWVLIDRIDNANDNAEFLFRYMRRHRRKINAWFVIRKGTADYRRLRKDGYLRIIPHGSLRWKLLMLNCRHLVSSHADPPIDRPPAITRLRPPRWRFSFLQHGVIKDDLSRWLNPKDLDRFFTSTRAEYESIVGHGSPYRYTERETKLTGMPRLDVLRAAGERVGPDDRDLLLLAPTWRRWLMTSSTESGTGQQPIDLADFVRTEFAQNWLGLVTDPRLKRLAEDQGVRVGLLMHPNLQPLSGELDLPEHVQVFTYDGQDIRTLFARARVLVTDYSSVSFDAAYIDRPVVYFQFDRDRAWSGEHPGRPGYFDYDRDGFGPVALTVGDAVSAIIETVEHGPEPRPEYLARIAETFPVRDGRCTERVFLEIRQSTRRAPKVEASYPAAALAQPRELAEVGSSRRAVLRGIAVHDLTEVEAGLMTRSEEEVRRVGRGTRQAPEPQDESA